MRRVRMDDVAQRVIRPKLVHCDAAEGLGACVVAIGGKEAVAHPHPRTLGEEYATNLAFLQFDFIEVARLSRDERHQRLVQSEVKKRNQKRDDKYRRGHLQAADSQLLACVGLARAVYKR